MVGKTGLPPLIDAASLNLNWLLLMAVAGVS